MAEIHPITSLGPGIVGEQTDLLRRLQGYFHTWATATELARAKFRRDYEYAEGNGKQWSAGDREKVERSGRPALEFNQIQPQIELIAGIQRKMELDYNAMPRGLEDRRIAEIASAALRAARDFIRLTRINDKVFDDGIICGLGAWEVIHTLDDADDLVWGDVLVNRINPLSFIYDPWSTDQDMQDGECMGKAIWMSLDEFVRRYPEKKYLAVPGEWLSRSGAYPTASEDLGTGPNLLRELYDHEQGRIRLLAMWYKVRTSIALMIDTESGMVWDVPSKDEGERLLKEKSEQVGRESVRKYQIITTDTTSAIVDEKGQIVPDPRTGDPMQFGAPEAANARLGELSKFSTMELQDRYKVVTRHARVPHWAEMVWWEVLASGPTPFKDRRYPFVPYISRQYADDPESIMGIVRNLIDPQDEYNKRYSQILAHINSSALSGWMNRKSGGASSKQLETMGSKPGVVVEYSSIPPTQIHPVELSQGHFQMLSHGERNILRISGVNAEMVGQTTQATVSGRAIRARQQGGTTILTPRFKAYEESQLDLAYMLLSRIQQFYPPEKLKRIIGITELATPLGRNGQSIFTNPITGDPMSDKDIMDLLKRMTTMKFDLTIRLSPATATERQSQFEQGVQLSGLITSTGRPIGPNTINALVDLADMPTRFAEGLKRDAEQPPQPELVSGKGGQNSAVQGLIAQLRAGRAGGSEGSIGTAAPSGGQGE